MVKLNHWFPERRTCIQPYNVDLLPGVMSCFYGRLVRNKSLFKALKVNTRFLLHELERHQLDSIARVDTDYYPNDSRALHALRRLKCLPS